METDEWPGESEEKKQQRRRGSKGRDGRGLKGKKYPLWREREGVSEEVEGQWKGVGCRNNEEQK